MKKLLGLLLFSTVVLSQSVPNGTIVQGQIWTPAQWNSAWQAKADYPPTGNVLLYGADPSGTLDSTTAIQTAINVSQNNVVSIPSGTYKFSALTFAGKQNTLFQCADRSNTHLLFTGTGDAITISQIAGIGGRITIRGCDIAASTLQSSGALISVIDDFYVRIEDNSFQSANAFNDISVSCSANTPNQIHIAGNQIFSAVNDGILLSCTNGSFSVADVYIEPGFGQRNYIKGAGNAGIELFGWLNGIFIIQNTIFGNNFGIIANDNGFGGSAMGSNTIVNNDIDTNTVGAIFTGLKSSLFELNHVFSGGITCVGCSNISAVGQQYQGASTGLTLTGTATWSDSGSHWVSSLAPVTIGPNGATASSDISIGDAQYVLGAGPFITFVGGVNPATRIMGSVELGTAATGCTSGTNATASTFMFTCGTQILQGALSGASSVSQWNNGANFAATNFAFAVPGITNPNTAISEIELSTNGNSPKVRWATSTGAVDSKFWEFVESTTGILTLRTINDANNAADNALVITRSGITVTNFTFGPAVDNPTYLFAGTGAITGVGSGLTALNGTNISSGTVASARLPASSVTLAGTSGSIGGGALIAGQCASGTATVTSATTSMVALADPNTYPGDGTIWDAQVTSANTVTVKVCAIIALTPTSSTYNVRVLQ